MRTVPPGAISGQIREIDGYGVVRQRLPVFEQFSDPLLGFHDHDVMPYGPGVYRVASVADTQNGTPILCTSYIPDLASFVPSFTYEGIALMPLSGVSAHDGHIFYHQHNGDVVRHWIAGSTSDVLFNYQSDVGLAAVSPSELYRMYHLSPTTYAVDFVGDVGHISTWHGAVYGENIDPTTLDAVRIGDTDYIVWQESGRRNARIIRRVGNVWSDSELVFPLDVVDDTFQFRLGGASVIDGRMVLVGTLIRNDDTLKIYTIGPDNFTLGREMYIARGRVIDAITHGREISLPIGKMLLVDDQLHVIGGDVRRHVAKSTILFGSDREDLKTEVGIHSVDLSWRANRPARATISLKSTNSPLVKSGNILDWHARINGVETRVGRFGIDAVLDTKDREGQNFDIICQSLSLKSMADWNSDSSFDFWSQTKQSSKASTLAEVIRSPGEWEEDEDLVRYMSMDRPGVLYTALRATRNGTSVGEFRAESDTHYYARYGVAIAYHRRIDEGNTVDNGIFFTVRSDTGVAYLHWVVDGEWRFIESAGPINPTSWHWLKVDLKDGRIRCYWRQAQDWVMLIDHRLETDEHQPYPWFENEVGKAAVFLENVVPGATSYGFDSEVDYVPVESVSDFPEEGIVKVDTEFIRYDGKTNDRSMLTPLPWRDGRVHPGVETPHYTWAEIPEDRVYESPGTGTFYRFGHGQQLLGGSFVALDSWHLAAVDVYFDKVGEGDAYAEVWIGNDDSDNRLWPPGNTILASQKRLFKSGASANMLAGEGEFSGGSGWVRFNLDVQLRRGEAYFIYVNNRLGQNIPPEGYFNVRFWRSEHPNHLTVRFIDNTTGWVVHPETMRMRLLGQGLRLPGHEVYLDTVDEPTVFDHYNDCILTCVEGRGMGRSFRIIGYDHFAPFQWHPFNPDQPRVGESGHGTWVDEQWRRVFVSEDPRRSFDETSHFIITPALQVTERGVESTATAHPQSYAAYVGGQASDIERGVEARTFEYFSGDKDIALGEMLTKIARKANVLDVSQGMRLTGNYPVVNDFDITRALLNAIPGESAIVDITVTDWKQGGIGLAVFPPGWGPGSGVLPTSVLVYEHHIVFRRGETPLQAFPTPQPVQGTFRISFQKDSYSVWNEGQFLTSFYWPESEAQETTFERGYQIGILNEGDLDCQVEWAELDTRVDNFILDIGQSALALSGSLIGEKRVYLLDDQNGNLRLFRERLKVNQTPLDLHISQSEGRLDNDLRTRFRSEGVEIVELTDHEAIAKHGNLFAMIGLREPDNIAETMRELVLVAEDSLKGSSAISLDGVVDLRVEPEDLILVRVGQDDYRFVRVEGLSLTMQSESPVFDMSIEGSVWENANLRAPQITSGEQAAFTPGKEQKFEITTDADPDASITIEGA